MSGFIPNIVTYLNHTAKKLSPPRQQTTYSSQDLKFFYRISFFYYKNLSLDKNEQYFHCKNMYPSSHPLLLWL